MRVIVFQEPASGVRVWVAQCLDVDMAAHAHAGGTVLDAVDNLGILFDARDREVTDCVARGDSIAHALKMPPASYEAMWEKAVPFGVLPMGAARDAEVRVSRESKLPAFSEL